VDLFNQIWSSRTLTKLKSQSQKRFHERKYQYLKYKNKNHSRTSRQTGSRNLMGPKTLLTIWGIYMKLVTKYQISVINSCWEKCDEKCAYMFNVYKKQLSRQTGSRNLTDPKTLPTKRFWTHQIPTSCLPTLLIFIHIEHICSFFVAFFSATIDATHNMVYLYDACDQISDFCHQQLLRKMRRKISWTDGQTNRGKTVYPPPPSGSGGIIIIRANFCKNMKALMV
jgi:hypothetical protein